MTRYVFVGAGNLAREMHAWMEYPKNVLWLDDVQPGFMRLDQYTHEEGDRVFIAVANPQGREKLWNLVCDQWNIHPYCMIHSTLVNSSANEPYGLLGIVAMPYSLISTGCKIGHGLVLNTHSSIGHDCHLGSFCTLASHVGLCGHVTVGDRVEFGVGAVVLPGIKIGSDAFIGAGSVVMRDVPAGARIAGNPAREIA